MADAALPGLEGGTDVAALLGGRLLLEQPKTGHRAGTDAVLLAAAASLEMGERFADVGAGVGTVGLAIAMRGAAARGMLMEVQPALAALASTNALRNGLGDRIDVETLDLFDRDACARLPQRFDLVVTNPPFYDASAHRAPRDGSKARAYVLGESEGATARVSLGDWLKASIKLLTPRGRLVVIHRADALGEILATADGRLGGVAIRPVYPRLGQPAVRILVAGVVGSRAPSRIVEPLVLHGEAGGFTPQAEAIHRGDALLPW